MKFFGFGRKKEVAEPEDPRKLEGIVARDEALRVLQARDQRNAVQQVARGEAPRGSNVLDEFPVEDPRPSEVVGQGVSGRLDGEDAYLLRRYDEMTIGLSRAVLEAYEMWERGGDGYPPRSPHRGVGLLAGYDVSFQERRLLECLEEMTSAAVAADVQEAVRRFAEQAPDAQPAWSKPREEARGVSVRPVSVPPAASRNVRSAEAKPASGSDDLDGFLGGLRSEDGDRLSDGSIASIPLLSPIREAAIREMPQVDDQVVGDQRVGSEVQSRHEPRFPTGSTDDPPLRVGPPPGLVTEAEHIQEVDDHDAGHESSIDQDDASGGALGRAEASLEDEFHALVKLVSLIADGLDATEIADRCGYEPDGFEPDVVVLMGAAQLVQKLRQNDIDLRDAGELLCGDDPSLLVIWGRIQRLAELQTEVLLEAAPHISAGREDDVLQALRTMGRASPVSPPTFDGPEFEAMLEEVRAEAREEAELLRDQITTNQQAFQVVIDTCASVGMPRSFTDGLRKGGVAGYAEAAMALEDSGGAWSSSVAHLGGPQPVPQVNNDDAMLEALAKLDQLESRTVEDAARIGQLEAELVSANGQIEVLERRLSDAVAEAEGLATRYGQLLLSCENDAKCVFDKAVGTGDGGSPPLELASDDDQKDQEESQAMLGAKASADVTVPCQADVRDGQGGVEGASFVGEGTPVPSFVPQHVRRSITPTWGSVVDQDRLQPSQVPTKAPDLVDRGVSSSVYIPVEVSPMVGPEPQALSLHDASVVAGPALVPLGAKRGEDLEQLLKDAFGGGVSGVKLEEPTTLFDAMTVPAVRQVVCRVAATVEALTQSRGAPLVLAEPGLKISMETVTGMPQMRSHLVLRLSGGEPILLGYVLPLLVTKPLMVRAGRLGDPPLLVDAPEQGAVQAHGVADLEALAAALPQLAETYFSIPSTDIRPVALRLFVVPVDEQGHWVSGKVASLSPAARDDMVRLAQLSRFAPARGFVASAGVIMVNEDPEPDHRHLPRFDQAAWLGDVLEVAEAAASAELRRRRQQS